jgi:hypothetical protein
MAMSFVLVNHEPSLHEASCSACAGRLRAGYVRNFPTGAPYCNYDCYRRHRFSSALAPWPLGSPERCKRPGQRHGILADRNADDHLVWRHRTLEPDGTDVDVVTFMNLGVSVGSRADDLEGRQQLTSRSKPRGGRAHRSRVAPNRPPAATWMQKLRPPPRPAPQTSTGEVICFGTTFIGSALDSNDGQSRTE